MPSDVLSRWRERWGSEDTPQFALDPHQEVNQTAGVETRAKLGITFVCGEPQTHPVPVYSCVIFCFSCLTLWILVSILGYSAAILHNSTFGVWPAVSFQASGSYRRSVIDGWTGIQVWGCSPVLQVCLFFLLKNLQYSFIKHLRFAGLRQPSENFIRHEHDMSYKFGSCPISYH